eukprot:CAMPEP_0113688518 /NCGR_PEP_ID=MMETSP0038_2-20120614/16582_1 /TAXON_ID=2898 /ORGANISM="Cryptomonas paramecium" /LENGTH=398 /DNA_ID=CAMNT_0000609345 /DNA_START=108 /DNA_END=1301 /DNA_ORIENTATION=- /assembly_acc=CAM_ASM_000170
MGRTAIECFKDEMRADVVKMIQEQSGSTPILKVDELHRDLILRDEKGSTTTQSIRDKEHEDNVVAADSSEISIPKADDLPLPQEGKVKYYVDWWKRCFKIDFRHFHMDQQATYSVTVAEIAKMRDKDILQDQYNIPDNVKILDGMACVGGDSISFLYHFRHGTVISNEYDRTRYRFLTHNLNETMKHLNGTSDFSATVHFRHGSVLDMWEDPLFKSCQMLYLDPEWGGVQYKGEDKIPLKIGGEDLHDSIISALRASESLKWVVLKLPFNYDNSHISKVLKSEGKKNETLLYAHRFRIQYKINGPVKMRFVVLARVSEKEVLKRKASGEKANVVPGVCTVGEWETEAIPETSLPLITPANKYQRRHGVAGSGSGAPPAQAGTRPPHGVGGGPSAARGW